METMTTIGFGIPFDGGHFFEGVRAHAHWYATRRTHTHTRAPALSLLCPPRLSPPHLTSLASLPHLTSPHLTSPHLPPPLLHPPSPPTSPASTPPLLPPPTPVVYFEAVIFIILNASIVGVLFARVAAANRRASQIIFSDKAVIRCVRNRFYFMLQVGEASFFTYHPVVEAHVRLYAVTA